MLCPSRKPSLLILQCCLLLFLFAPQGLLSATAPAAGPDPKALADKRFEARKAAILALSASEDPALRRLLDDYKGGSLYLWQGRLVVVTETEENDDFEDVGHLADALTRQALPGPGVLVSKLTGVSPGPQDYDVLKAAEQVQGMADPDPAKRRQAFVEAGESGDGQLFAAVSLRLGAEKDPGVLAEARRAQRLLILRFPGQATEGDLLGAIEAARRDGQANALDALRALKPSSDAAVAAAADKAVSSIETHLSLIRGVGHVFSGLSLGSILVLMTLGLSVTFGLMRVINMAHGELMMLGAYTAYLMQRFFELHLPAAAWNGYFVLALPAAFVTAAAAGWLIERLVVRHLYGRPLETLLATWGVSMILIQSVRVAFGDNIAVNSPSWFQGGIEVLPGLVLAYNRLFIIALCAACVALTYGLMGRTRLGLMIRASTQNRPMAASLGVDIRRVDALTFAFGSGLAGVAGCALTLIGGVTPNMGQTFIVDSFLVVVSGGVGKLAGAVWAGMGLGVLNKFFEPWVEAVWAKVLILVCVVLFIQWKPSGLFPAKGRGAADAD